MHNYFCLVVAVEWDEVPWYHNNTDKRVPNVNVNQSAQSKTCPSPLGWPKIQHKLLWDFTWPSMVRIVLWPSLTTLQPRYYSYSSLPHISITWLTTFPAAILKSPSHPPGCNLFMSSESFLALRISFCSIMVYKCSVSNSFRSSLSKRCSLASRNSFSAFLYRFLQKRKMEPTLNILWLFPTLRVSSMKN